MNFDLPPDSKTYIHRVGRTARAGKAGHAISLVTQYDIEIWQRIETALGKKLGEWDAEREEVLVLGERVGEAQRVAIKEMKDLHEKRGGRGAVLRGRRGGRGGGSDGRRGGGGGGGGGRRRRDEMDREEG